MVRLTDDQLGILNSGNFAAVATLMPDGSPHVTIVWIESDGDHVYFNTAAPGKSRNLRHDSRVAIAMFDPQNPYRAVSIRGKAELIRQGANEHMNRLSRKYTGHDFDGFQSGETRFMVRVIPEVVHSQT